MSWTLDIQRGGGGPVISTASELDPRGVVGGFTWRTAGSGDCVDCAFEAFTDQAGLRNRDIISVKVDGNPVFFGPVVELPHPRDTRRGAVDAVGGRELLTRRVIGPETYLNTDVGFIAALLTARYRHPALKYDPVNFQVTGRVLSEFTMPWRTLGGALETLSKSLGDGPPVPFGVRADGHVFFGTFSSASVGLSVADLSDLQWLRVSGDEVVTSSYLIALNKMSGTEPSRIGNYPIGYRREEEQGGVVLPSPEPGMNHFGAPYTPATYVLQADDPQWSGLQTEAANLIPDGADILNTPGTGLPPVFALFGLLDGEGISDGDPGTHARNDPAEATYAVQYNLEQGVDADPVIGFRLVYSLNLEGFTGLWRGEVTLQYSYPNPAGETPSPRGNGATYLQYATLTCDFALGDTKGGRREITAFVPISEAMLVETMGDPFTISTPTPYKAELNAGMYVLNADPPFLPSGGFKIYSLEPIFLSRTKLDALARTFLRPPAQEPTELTVPYLLLPTFAVTLLDAPGGPVSGDVAELEGHLDSKGGLKTVIKLEQPGASVDARMLRLVAQSRAGEAVTQLRGFLER